MSGGGDGDPVPGQVMRSADTPRSYIVSTPSGLVRRSTRHLVAIPKMEEHQEAEHQPSFPWSCILFQSRMKCGTQLVLI